MVDLGFRVFLFKSMILHTIIHEVGVQMFFCFFFLPSQAETRAEFAERSVAKLEKTIDDLEGKNLVLRKP